VVVVLELALMLVVLLELALMMVVWELALSVVV